MGEPRAEILLPAGNLVEDVAFYTGTLGMRLEEIFPADEPRIALLSGHGLRVRLQKGSNQGPGTIRILTDEPRGFADGQTELFAPNGTRVEIAELNPPLVLPETDHRLVLSRLADGAVWVTGRAGMHYRDLIPRRLGEAVIASHIRLDGGPVDDAVHYHRLGFQVVYCCRGWLDVVYEDQGEPFRLEAGACVVQPPAIRHRALAASPDVELVEVAVPAEHVTTIDHDMTLPNGPARPDRLFDGQRLLHGQVDGAPSAPHRIPGFSSRDLGVAAATNGTACVSVVERGSGATGWAAHDADVLFTFVLGGGLTLEADGVDAPLGPGDAFVIPPGMPARYADPTEDLELLEVALPGTFETRVSSE